MDRYPDPVLAAPQLGFVFLSMPKTASTSIEESLRSDALIATGSDPRVKHISYRGFERVLVPWLKRVGYPRESYEVICLIREPISWLHSWYRYRSRDTLADPEHARHSVYTGSSSFDEFARSYLHGDKSTSFGRQANFVKGANRPIGPDRIYRYEDLDIAVHYLESQVGHRLKLRRRNVSPKLSLELSPQVEDQLRSFLEPEYRLWTLAGDEVATAAWSVDKGLARS
jgi:hypothetical protein